MSLSPQDFPQAAPSGNPLDSGTYFTVYSDLSPYTDTVYHASGTAYYSAQLGALCCHWNLSKYQEFDSSHLVTE